MMTILISDTNINTYITITLITRYEQQGIGLHWENINLSPLEGVNNVVT